MLAVAICVLTAAGFQKFWSSSELVRVRSLAVHVGAGDVRPAAPDLVPAGRASSRSRNPKPWQRPVIPAGTSCRLRV